MVYLPLFSEVDELRILSDVGLISKMNQYMFEHNISYLLVNQKILDAGEARFRELSADDWVDELVNSHNVLRFFIQYQYYNFAVDLKARLYCRLV